MWPQAAKATNIQKLVKFDKLQTLKISENSAIIIIESERESNSPLPIKNWVAAYARKVFEMTKRDFYTAISKNETLDAELRTFADASLAKLDDINSKRREKVSKVALANMPLIDAVVAMLTAEPQTASMLTPKMNAAFPSADDAEEMKVQKISHLLTEAVKAGRCSVMDVKVKGKGTQKGYFIAE